MNKAISIIRIVILLSLGMLAIWMVFGEEQDRETSAWVIRFFIDKALGLGLCLIISLLYRRWSKVDPWLKAYNRMCDEVIDCPDYF